MSKTKSIDNIYSPPPVHMVGDGFRVHTYFPSHLMDQRRMSPFYLMDYNSKFYFEPSEKPRGVGVHPHRGFETVTIAFKGKVAHHDSTGQSGVIAEGDVQWMTAAKGILHKEYHEQEFSRKGGIFQMVQLWVNLPSKYKMSEPKYQPIQNSEMGKYALDENGSFVTVIAGEYNGVKGPASTFTPMHVYTANLKENISAKFTLPQDFNTCVLVLDGKIKINGDNKAIENQLVLFKNDGDELSVRADTDSQILVLSGQPIDEPIMQYGPFLMNTKEEIVQAFDDFNTGKFGFLED